MWAAWCTATLTCSDGLPLLSIQVLDHRRQSSGAYRVAVGIVQRIIRAGMVKADVLVVFQDDILMRAIL